MNSIFARWISVHLIYGDPVICLSSIFASLKSRPEIYFIEFCSASTELLGIKLSWPKFTQLKNDLSQNNCLVFVVFLTYNFHLSLAALRCNIIRFLLLNAFYVFFFAEDLGIRVDEILLKRNFFNMLLLFLRRLRNRSE